MVQVPEEIALLGGEVAIAAAVDFALAGEGRHFAESAHGIENFARGGEERALKALGLTPAVGVASLVARDGAVV